MNISEEINKYSENNIRIPEKDLYSVILGLNPSKGARSPKLWNSAYDFFKISAEMIPIDVKTSNFNKVLSILESDPNFSGGAIAAPHKESAAQYLSDNLTKEAKSIGTINCLYRNKARLLFGTNTDGEGALNSFLNTYGSIKEKKILILGIGGTGKAVAAYFANEVDDPKQVYLSSRSSSAEIFSKKIDCNFIEWENFRTILFESDIVINCTSMGSSLNPGLSPIEEFEPKKLKNNLIVFDVIYDPNPTPLLEKAMNFGFKNLNGSLMNIEQAVIGFHYSASYGLKNLDVNNIRKAMH